MARLAIVTYLALAIAGVFGVALPPAMSPPISLPEEWAKATNLTAIPSPKSPAHERPILAARAGVYDKDYTDQPPPPPKVKPRPHKFTPAKTMRCIATFETGPCCGPLSNPPSHSDECREKWGDPDYKALDEIAFCNAQRIPQRVHWHSCGTTPEDGGGPVMVVPERKPGYEEEDQEYTTRLVGEPLGG